jgi:hypothetical protein
MRHAGDDGAEEEAIPGRTETRRVSFARNIDGPQY